MAFAFQGRVGQTLLGEHAPVPSTSRPAFPSASGRIRLQGRPRRGYHAFAQLQREDRRDESPRDTKHVSSSNGSSGSGNGSQPSQQESAVAPKSATNGAAAPPQASEAAVVPASNNWLIQQWDKISPQYKLIFACAIAFVICNMDKVNISVAIISMRRDFGWNTTVSGIVQSSFFAGYMFTQIPGGYVVGRLGGRRVLPAGVTMWSSATAVTPLLAGSLPGMLLCRALVGLGEGVAPTSATDMVARVCRQEERSRAIGFILSGLHAGALAGLLVAPILIESLGWPAVFYIFGGAGLVWSWWWESLLSGLRKTAPEMMASLEDIDTSADGQAAVPWRAFLRNTPIRALAYVHFCNNWAAYTMTAWLPSYFSTALSLDLTQASQASLFPPLAATIASAGAGPIADSLVARGVPVALVRKSFQGLAFLGPCVFLGLVCRLGGDTADGNEKLTIGLVSIALGLASVSVAGLYSNHADLSRKYASILLGLTNTTAAIPGIIGVTITGVIYDRTNNWNLALFAPAIFFYSTGALIFALFGSADAQRFEDNSEFWFEDFFKPVTSRISAAAGQVSERAKGVLARIRKDQ